MLHPIWENLTNGFINYSLDSYNILGIWLYPLLLLGIVGYIYASMHSITVAVVGIIITIGVFASTSMIFVNVPIITQFLYIIVVLGICMLLVGVFIKRTS